MMHYIVYNMDIFRLVWSIASCQLLTYSVYEQMEISFESPKSFSVLSWNIRCRRTLLDYRLPLRTKNLTYLLFLFELLARSLLQLEVNPWFKISVHNSEPINISFYCFQNYPFTCNCRLPVLSSVFVDWQLCRLLGFRCKNARVPKLLKQLVRVTLPQYLMKII